MPTTTVSKSGGIAGRIVVIKFTPDGDWTREENRKIVGRGTLSEAQRTELGNLLRSDAYAKEKVKPVMGCADGITYRVVTSSGTKGTGTCGADGSAPLFMKVVKLAFSYTGGS